MPTPRNALVDTSQTPYYHCISRCVRRAFLCGEDKLTGRIHFRSTVFVVEICAYAVMSNHYHIVVFINEAKAHAWSNDEVLKRWTQIYKGPLLVQRYLSGATLTISERETVSDLINIYRKRLANLSWFMKALNEPISRDANSEDHCTGRFWEGRFKSYALLDEASIISAMAYVDLNPIRAGVADTPEDSDFTSIQQRLLETAKNLSNQEQAQESKSVCFHPFVEHTVQSSPQLGLRFSVRDYFTLVDWTGRATYPGKSGCIPEHHPPIQ